MDMFLALIAYSSAATLKVGPAETYKTINSAVDAATSGDTISVGPGTYTEDIDLRGLTLNVVGESGPAVTTISTGASIELSGGTFEGFTISPAADAGVRVVSGSPTIRDLIIDSPSSYGVAIGGGGAIVEEVAVYDAGHSGFYVTAGTAQIKRSIAVRSAKYGFYLKGGGSAYNSLALGGLYGFVTQTASPVVSHCASLGSSTGALVTAIDTTFTNGVFGDSPFVVVCNGGAPTFSDGLGYSVFAAKSCDSTALDGLSEADPRFVSYTTGADPWEMDLRPGSGSPLTDAGSGLDADGSVADLGIFGGAQGSWRDRDGDGVVVHFDCDDHDGSRYPGATEREDGIDQDCDGIIDEDVPVDTGGDTGGDTGTDTDTDTGSDTASDRDIDGDGYPGSLDCGDHNVATYPGAPEILDSADNDCDGVIDEGTAGGDDDGDGFSELAGDCDDNDATRAPNAEETPRDGVDQDCNGVDSSPRHQDGDGDGYTDDSDCDDTDPNTHPNAADATDGKDNDCDGLADDDALNADKDGDGVTPAEGDCNESDPQVNSRAYDVPDDFIDQDCTGEDNYDVDRDGHASAKSGGEDCDDLRSTTHPGALEICDDTLDNDCNGAVNDDCGDSGIGDEEPDCGCASGGAGGATAALVGATLLTIRRRRATIS